MTVGMDSELTIIHNAIINIHVLYRDFFQQDVEEFGFDSPPFDQEAGSEQAADPIVD
jgi:hypothetical protein